MMNRALIPLMLILTACDSATPPQPKTEHRPDPAFETQIQAVKKARAVEGQVMDAAEAQRKQIEETSQP